VFVPGKYYQPCLIFVGKAMSLPLSGTSERCLICLGSSLTSKFKTRLERLSRDKHSGLLRKFINYGGKKIYNIWPRKGLAATAPQILRHSIKKFQRTGLALSQSVCPNTPRVDKTSRGWNDFWAIGVAGTGL